MTTETYSSDPCHRAALLGILCLLLGCPTDDDDATDDDTGDDDDAADDDDTAPSGPCADGVWGLIQDPDSAIHVRADGSDDGDGSAEAPLASVLAAVELARAGGGSRIAIGPGTYPTTVSLSGEAGDDPTDSGLVIEGCSSDEVTLEADDAMEPVIKISESTDVRLAGFTTQGGMHALAIWSGATAEVDQVVVRDASRAGVSLAGWDTEVVLQQVQVHDMLADAGADGYGIEVQEATVTMTGGGVWNARVVGFLATLASVELTGVTVQGTQPAADGSLGRGIQLQEMTIGTIQDAVITDNYDVGLYSILSLELTLQDSTISGTIAGIVPGEDYTTGDGIRITQGDGAFDPSGLIATLTGNTASGNARAGILIQDITGELTGNTAGGDNGMSEDDLSIYAIGNAVMTGADPYIYLDEFAGAR